MYSGAVLQCWNFILLPKMNYEDNQRVIFLWLSSGFYVETAKLTYSPKYLEWNLSYFFKLPLIVFINLINLIDQSYFLYKLQAKNNNIHQQTIKLHRKSFFLWNFKSINGSLMQYKNITLWIIESFNIFSDLYLSNEGWTWNTMYKEAPF